MEMEKNARNFHVLMHPRYGEDNRELPIVQESSAIGNYPDAFDKPGSSFLWIGSRHHLDREEVKTLIVFLQHWLETGSLKL